MSSTSETTPSQGNPTYPIPGLPLYEADLLSIGLYVIIVFSIVARFIGDSEWSFPFLSRFFNWTKNLNPISHFEEQVALLKTRSALAEDFADRALAVSDSQGKLVWANKEARRLMGNIHLDDAIGDGWMALIHQEDREAVFREWKRSQKEKIDFRMRYRYQKFGEPNSNCIDAHAYISQTPSGKVAGWVALLEEVDPHGKCCARKLPGAL